MKLGNYREYITLQQPATVNTKGTATQTWSTVANVFASILPIRPVENMQQGSPQAVATYTIRIHFRTDITASWRVLWEGKTLELTSVYDPDGDRRELELVGGVPWLTPIRSALRVGPSSPHSWRASPRPCAPR